MGNRNRVAGGRARLALRRQGALDRLPAKGRLEDRRGHLTSAQASLERRLRDLAKSKKPEHDAPRRQAEQELSACRAELATVQEQLRDRDALEARLRERISEQAPSARVIRRRGRSHSRRREMVEQSQVVRRVETEAERAKRESRMTEAELSQARMEQLFDEIRRRA